MLDTVILVLAIRSEIRYWDNVLCKFKWWH